MHVFEARGQTAPRPRALSQAERIARNAPGRCFRANEVHAAGVEKSGRAKAITGRIDLAGSPAGAKVYLDGYYSGNLPCIIESVEAGSYGLEVRQEGFKEWKESILVKADSTLNLMIHQESRLQ